MAVDINYLRRHYASLSDEALLEVDRGELVAAAQECYDSELKSRGLGANGQPAASGAPPDWFDEAAEVFSRVDHPGAAQAPEVEAARQALEDAGIPCHLEFAAMPEEAGQSRHASQERRLLVPSQLNLHAMNVIDRDIFNDGFEAGWRSHLEMLSDEELESTDPEDVFCGLFDRIERVTRAYREELERRGLGA